MCDSSPIWMWILDTIGEQYQCIRHILLKHKAWYQTPWLCKKCTNPWGDKHPVSHQHCKATSLRFLGHILRIPEDEPCRRNALYVPSHGSIRPGRQTTSYIICPETNRGCRRWAPWCWLLTWRKFVVASSAAEWWWGWWWWWRWRWW